MFIIAVNTKELTNNLLINCKDFDSTKFPTEDLIL